MKAIIHPTKAIKTDTGRTITIQRISYEGTENVPQASQPKARRAARRSAATASQPNP